MIQEIQARTLLSSTRGVDDFFGLRYNFNIYRGCPHQCIYCDSRSECYGIENFNDVLVKTNAAELLARELPRKRRVGPIGTGSMSDPYNPLERRYELTRRCLAVIAACAFPVRIITKGDLVLRDLDLLLEINRAQAVVCFTLTTTDDALAHQVEPGAPPPSARLAAMRGLAARGIAVGTTLMPVLPFLEDSEANLTAILEQTAAHGGSFAIPGLGLTLRDRQRAWFYQELDRRFPGLREKYERRYGQSYSCPVPNVARLNAVFEQTCARLGLAARMPPYVQPLLQPGLF
jgi:DNA repair photolyase